MNGTNGPRRCKRDSESSDIKGQEVRQGADSKIKCMRTEQNGMLPRYMGGSS